MPTVTYKLAKVIDRRPHYAAVTVTAEPAAESSVAVSPQAFAWLREAHGDTAVDTGPGFDPQRHAAAAGAARGLGVTAARVVIDQIRFSETDTVPDDIAAATCAAVRQALGRPVT